MTHIHTAIFIPSIVKGTGLGLSLSYDIIKANDGEILVNSQIGEGTEFTVFLPYQSN
jgi:signal transduction histidine kinase